MYDDLFGTTSSAKVVQSPTESDYESSTSAVSPPTTPIKVNTSVVNKPNFSYKDSRRHLAELMKIHRKGTVIVIDQELIHHLIHSCVPDKRDCQPIIADITKSFLDRPKLSVGTRMTKLMELDKNKYDRDAIRTIVDYVSHHIDILSTPVKVAKVTSPGPKK